MNQDTQEIIAIRIEGNGLLEACYCLGKAPLHFQHQTPVEMRVGHAGFEDDGAIETRERRLQPTQLSQCETSIGVRTRQSGGKLDGRIECRQRLLETIEFGECRSLVVECIGTLGRQSDHAPEALGRLIRPPGLKRDRPKHREQLDGLSTLCEPLPAERLGPRPVVSAIRRQRLVDHLAQRRRGEGMCRSGVCSVVHGAGAATVRQIAKDSGKGGPGRGDAANVRRTENGKQHRRLTARWRGETLATRAVRVNAKRGARARPQRTRACLSSSPPRSRKPSLHGSTNLKNRKQVTALPLAA